MAGRNEGSGDHVLSLPQQGAGEAAGRLAAKRELADCRAYGGPQGDSDHGRDHGVRHAETARRALGGGGRPGDARIRARRSAAELEAEAARLDAEAAAGTRPKMALCDWGDCATSPMRPGSAASGGGGDARVRSAAHGTIGQRLLRGARPSGDTRRGRGRASHRPCSNSAVVGCIEPRRASIVPRRRHGLAKVIAWRRSFVGASRVNKSRRVVISRRSTSA